DTYKEIRGSEVVFHLAADPNVKNSMLNPRRSLEINIQGTLSLLESCRKADIEHLLFASTSAVYGAAKIIPTPEDSPCFPISNYGASKLACEAYIHAYSYSYGIKASILRLANIFGERSTHGVMFDFFHKIKKNPYELEILGDGKQDKSYLYVQDCISAFIYIWKKQKRKYDVFNVGSKEKISVDYIAKKMCSILSVNPKLKYTGTKYGWVGDVTSMLLDTNKLERLGWKQKFTFDEGLRRYLRWLQKNYRY
ncbi:MAG: GDP-mannose 4,6-dehydratase, partial [Candidatus Anstonellales archaeon]